MRPFEITGLPPDELNSFLTGTHSDPFRILGPHRVGDDLKIRVFRPDAEKIDIVLNRPSTEPIAAERIHRDGFFAGLLPGPTVIPVIRFPLTTRMAWERRPRIRNRTGRIRVELNCRFSAKEHHG